MGSIKNMFRLGNESLRFKMKFLKYYFELELYKEALGFIMEEDQ